MRTNSVFIDTFGWMAYLVATEDYHALAIEEMDHALDNPSISVYTTDHVIAELVALMNGRRIPRPQLLRDVDSLLIAPRILKLFTDQSLFLEAWELLKNRADKVWSLADAISFLHMQRLGITEVLTNDHHFEQAGFVCLQK